MVKRKDIDINALHKSNLFAFFFLVYGSLFHHFSKHERIIRFRMASDKHILTTKISRGDFLKPFVIFPKHPDIKVIIPRNKSLMTNGTKECSAVNKIADMI